MTATRALAKADAIDAAPGARRNARAARGRAVRGQEPVRRRGAADARRIEDQSRSRAGQADATLIARLEAAGAILVGALNMGEYAYDFTGENAHDGPSRNPHDLERMTGGSSGGSAAAVAGGLVPIALGSDTNGSIRVPRSLCGIFGLKPTYGRLSRAGTFPFVASLDHLGPLARSVGDLALELRRDAGPDDADPAQADVARDAGIARPRRRASPGFASRRLGGYFARCGEPGAFSAVERIARALKADARRRARRGR